MHNKKGAVLDLGVESWGYPSVNTSWSHFDAIPASATDWRTERQTSRWEL